MNILILGSGAREHAIAWAVKQNPKCSRLLVAPGNAGIADIAEISKTNIENCDEVVDLAKREKIDFVIIGPEAPLAAGVSDALKIMVSLFLAQPKRLLIWKFQRAL